MTATAKSHQRDGYRRRHSVATGARAHLPPASRCASVPLSASISRSCSFPAPSRPWPAQTGWNGPGAHQMIDYRFSSVAIPFSAFSMHCDSSSPAIKVPLSAGLLQEFNDCDYVRLYRYIMFFINKITNWRVGALSGDANQCQLFLCFRVKKSINIQMSTFYQYITVMS